MAEERLIVAVEVPARRSRFLGLSVGRPRVPRIKPGMHLYVSRQQPDGSRELRRVMAEGSTNLDLSLEGARFYHVGLGSYPFSPTFSKAVTDEQGHEWDCRVVGQLCVSDSRRVLTSFARTIATPSSPVTPSIAESWTANRIAPRVRDAVRAYSIADLRDRQALPPSWWERELTDWLDEFGVTVRVDDVSWSSAQAEAAEAEAARQCELERVTVARQREQEAELIQAAAKAEYEKRKKQIESDLKLSDQEQAHQLQLLEKRHRKELIEADMQIENAQREAERAALEHEATLARLRHDAGAVRQAEEQDRQAEERHQTIVKELDELNSTLAELADLPENLLAQLAGQDARKAHAAAERIVSPEFGVLPTALARLGYGTTPQMLMQYLRERATTDSRSMGVEMEEIRTRDIGTETVDALRINSSLRFRFDARRTGHVTLLNLGTSGSAYLHVPNAYARLGAAKVTAGAQYSVPGPELLPPDAICYYEKGPPGWEHLVLVVSDAPLPEESIVNRSTRKRPVVKLSPDEFQRLCVELTGRDPETWSAGILSFLVG